MRASRFERHLQPFPWRKGEAPPSPRCVCKRPGFPGPAASSCRADLSKALLQTPPNPKQPTEGSHPGLLMARPTEGRQRPSCEQACPLSKGCPGENPTEEIIEN